MDVKSDFDPGNDPDDLDHFHHQQHHQQRRPRGFAAAAAAASAGGAAAVAGGKGNKEREREREKERTKLRERHRRAITSRMLAGLRQHGNFTLPARSDMNDVLAALAREAGWTVEGDGTTYRSNPPSAPFPMRNIDSPLSGSALKSCTVKTSLACPPVALRMDDSLSPASLDSAAVADRDLKSEKFAHSSPINSPECLDADQHMQDFCHGAPENNIPESTYIPVYVMLPLGIINGFCQLVDPDGLRRDLRHLKSLNVDGVVVDCWWGIVEGWPQNYQWSGYRDLFNIVREVKLKLQVVMAFYEYGGSGVGDMLITLPRWILEIGKENPDIFFMDREGRRNSECLSWGVDKERVFKGRTAVEVYFDFMRSFRVEFDDLFVDGFISAIEIGLGPSGGLQYPSFPEKIGWKYPGIGEFQCYDKYLQRSLQKAANLQGHPMWSRGPENAGQYNSKPHETGFFCNRGDYDSYYGRFFLQWYSQALIDHADSVLFLAKLLFEDTEIVVKIPAVYWWYRTASHAAELTAGFYNSSHRDGYAAIFDILKKHSVTAKFAYSSLHPYQETDEAMSDSEGLTWQVMNSAWDQGVAVAGQNAFPCFDRDSYARILETAKHMNSPDHRHLSSFTYLRMSSLLMQRAYSSEFEHFVECMHGNDVALRHCSMTMNTN
ncbi:beta-amylase 8 [Nymphaea colorata]|nr:beta-amylase 8 [Nymphaea colorata]